MSFRIHKEGILIISICAVLFALLLLLSYLFIPLLFPFLCLVLAILFAWVVSFFRNPDRQIPDQNERKIYAPADGKIVVIESTMESEYFKDMRIQISIFMSPMNVHVNRNPISGTVAYIKYHAGKFLVAWHPKSSTENERNTVVYDSEYGAILVRQIAGAMARRIISYPKTGDKVQQGDDFGFIRFGSRVDVFLPLDSKILVQLDQKAKGNLTVLAMMPEK